MGITEGLNYDDQLCSEGQTIFRVAWQKFCMGDTQVIQMYVFKLSA